MTLRSPSRTRHLLALACVVLVAGASTLTAPVAAAQQRRVVVVGDSIVLGAEGPMVAGFSGRGWEVTFDAAVSRSTADAVAAVASHRPLLGDSLVLSFGANDSGNPAAFRQRVDQLLDSVADVPRVYWLTIREVRDYYGPANQVLRDAAASRPNVTVIDWHAASAGRSDLTASDGLHLSGAGASTMTDLVLRAVVEGSAPPLPESPPAPPPPPVPEPPPTPAPPPPPDPTPAPTTLATTTTAPVTTTAPPTSAAVVEPVRTGAVAAASERDGPSGFDGIRALGLTLGAAVLVVLAVLGGSGLLLGGWAIATAGRRAESATDRRDTDDRY